MNAELVDGIAKAVLYEGYMLYPYRPSSVKNHQRFNFGVVYPRPYSERQGGTDAWKMQTECLVAGNDDAGCLVRVRFLRIVTRSIARVLNPAIELSSASEDAFERLPRLAAGEEIFQERQEAHEEAFDVDAFKLSSVSAQSKQWPFQLSAKREREAIRDQSGLIAGIIQRDRANISGIIDLFAERLTPGLFKLRILVSNTSCMDVPAAPNREIDREIALSRALVSAHTILEASGAEFVSLIDPPEDCRRFAAQCQNVGTWPVLVGRPGERDMMLSSPIILYDYPEIAPESPGDLFDGAEIDEILSLRILTMTEEEKQEMRESDDRTRKILERTENMPAEQWMKLHGAMRELRSATGDKP